MGRPRSTGGTAPGGMEQRVQGTEPISVSRPQILRAPAWGLGRLGRRETHGGFPHTGLPPCLPACRGGRLGAAGILGSWYCWYRLCSLVSRTTAPRPGRLSGSSHPPATGCKAVSSCCLAHLGSRMLGQTWGQWRHDKGLAYFLIWD